MKINWHFFCVPILRANHERQGCIILSQLWLKLPICPKRRIFGKMQYSNLFGVARMPRYYTKIKNILRLDSEILVSQKNLHIHIHTSIK